MKAPLLQRMLLIIAGISFFFIALEIGLRLGGVIFSAMQEHRNMSRVREKGTYRILCIGESTTALGGRYSYPAQLEEILNQRNIGIGFSVINKGKPVINTSYILSQLEDNLGTCRPDMVIAMMGINDYYIKYYGEAYDTKDVLFDRFRVYRLFRLICKHFRSRYGESKLPAVKTNKNANIFSLSRSGENEMQQNTGSEELACIRSGWAYKEQGDFQAAEDKFSEAVRINPRSDKAYSSLGVLYADKGDVSSAKKMFAQALKINPGNSDAYVGLGWLYRDEGKLMQSEEAFQSAINLNPHNHWAYLGLGWFCADQDNYSRAEEMFSKALEIRPGSDEAYLGMGKCLRAQGAFAQAEGALKKSIELSSGKPDAYLALGWCYSDQKKYKEAEGCFNKALEMAPKDPLPYLESGRFYKERKEYKESEKLLSEAIKINPDNYWAYLESGWSYESQGKYRQAELMFKKATELESAVSLLKKDMKAELGGAFIELGGCYRDQDKYALAESAFKRAVELNPKNDRAYGALALLYEETGENELAQLYYGKANGLRAYFYSVETRHNYQRLKELLENRKIKLVCVQYPMRSLRPLMQLFKDKEGIIFIDNEGLFKEAVRKDGYRYYFVDMFADDFGHCTPAGNRLLAENIADNLIKEYFRKDLAR